MTMRYLRGYKNLFQALISKQQVVRSISSSPQLNLKEFDPAEIRNIKKVKNQYSRFYNPKVDMPDNKAMLFLAFLMFTFTSMFFGGFKKYVDKFENFARNRGIEARKQMKGPSAATIKDSSDSSDSDTDTDENKEDEDSSRKRAGFRDRRIIGYEDRIRAYSTPDKIFRYFSTLKVTDADGYTEIFMTPLDFVRSITPGVKQPDGLGLDSFKKFDPSKDKLHLDIPEDSVFHHFGENAIISFTDYVFLLTVISTPQKQFEIAFRMFDINGDGDLDSDEFELVRSVILGTTAIGKRHRDHSVTGNTLKTIDSSLQKYLFGPNKDEKLTIAKFVKFQQTLQKEIMRLEFERYNPENGKIREIDFAESLLTYGGFPPNKKKKMLKRIKQKFVDDAAVGISFDEYAAFSQLLRSITDVDTALTFYNLAGAPIDQNTLRHVTSAVANVSLSDHVVDVVFTLFDENNDGQLSNKEFISVMKQKLLRGLDKPMDTGFIRLVNAMFSCAKEQATFQKSDY